MLIREVRPSDAAEWLRLRMALWPDADAVSERDQINQFLSAPGPPALPTLHAAFVCEQSGVLCGLVEVSIRPYADGCETNDVGYLEAWYVDPERRGKGIGRVLVEAAEEWAVRQGCVEMASDTDLDNVASGQAHRRLGYTEVGRVVQFCKKL